MRREEAAGGCHEHVLYAVIKEAVAMQCETIDAVMYVSISKKPLTVGNAQKGFNK